MNPTVIWVVLDHDGKVIEFVTDKSMLPFVQSYVDKANSAGDDWRLLRYELATDFSTKSDVITTTKVNRR